MGMEGQKEEWTGWKKMDLGPNVENYDLISSKEINIVIISEEDKMMNDGIACPHPVSQLCGRLRYRVQTSGTPPHDRSSTRTC